MGRLGWLGELTVGECASCDDDRCGHDAAGGDQGVSLSSWAERVFWHFQYASSNLLVLTGFGKGGLGRCRTGELISLVERNQRGADAFLLRSDALRGEMLGDALLGSFHLGYLLRLGINCRDVLLHVGHGG